MKPPRGGVYGGATWFFLLLEINVFPFITVMLAKKNGWSIWSRQGASVTLSNGHTILPFNARTQNERAMNFSDEVGNSNVALCRLKTRINVTG